MGRREDLLGLRGIDTGEVVLKDLRVPRQNLLGKPDEGFRVLLHVETLARIRAAATQVGLAQAALDESIKYAKARYQRGHPIAEFQTIQWLLAEMASKVEAARWLTYRAAFLLDQGEPVRKESSLAKLFATQAGMDVARDALQVHGAYGYTKDYTVERIFRDAKYGELTEGVAEIQRVIIALEL